MQSNPINLLLSVIIMHMAFVAFAAPKVSGKTTVRAASIKESEFYNSFTSTAQCKNLNSRTYHVNVPGRVDLVSAKQGDYVKSGDIIIAIQKDLANATMLQAESTLTDAKMTLDRDQTLFAKKVISKEQLQKAQVMYGNAKLALEQAVKNYNDMIIKAPFDGKIGVVRAIEGDYVKTGELLFTIVSDSPKSLFLELPESIYKQLLSTDEAFITLEGGHKLPCKLVAISDYVSDQGTITAQIITELPDTKLLHGSFVEVDLIMNKHIGIGVPEQAVLKGDKGSFVYKIAENNMLKRIYITPKTRTNNLIEINQTDLQIGDKVVIEGLTKAQENLVVEILE